jgi:hypothetical protein
MIVPSTILVGDNIYEQYCIEYGRENTKLLLESMAS